MQKYGFYSKGFLTGDINTIPLEHGKQNGSILYKVHKLSLNTMIISATAVPTSKFLNM